MLALIRTWTGYPVHNHQQFQATTCSCLSMAGSNVISLVQPNLASFSLNLLTDVDSDMRVFVMLRFRRYRLLPAANFIGKIGLALHCICGAFAGEDVLRSRWEVGVFMSFRQVELAFDLLFGGEATTFPHCRLCLM